MAFRRADYNPGAASLELARLLELAEVPDSGSLRKLMLEMDSSRSGRLGEDDFLRMFKRLSNNQLRRRLRRTGNAQFDFPAGLAARGVRPPAP